MSSQKYAAPLRLDRRPSRLLGAVTGIAHVTGLALLPALTLTPWITTPLALAICISLITILREHVLLLAPRSVTRLVWREDGIWILLQTNGVETSAYLLPGTFVHRNLVVLRFALTSSRHRIAVVLTQDNLDPESFRRLRVRLNMDSGSSKTAVEHV